MHTDKPTISLEVQALSECLMVIAENDYQLDGALSIFADSARKVIPKIPFTGHPVTERGDIKGPEIEISPSVFAPVYNYNALAASYTDRPFFIDDVTVSKFCS